MAGSSKAIYAALAGNVAVGTTKLIAAAFTGSSAMFSEGLHSVVDAGNEVLLLFGKRRSALPPDETHPFGYGQELYFWTLLVSLIIFTVGGAVSAYEGILRLLHPTRPEPATWSYIVLGAAAVFEGISFVIGYRQFRRQYPNQRFFDVVRTSKDPTIFTVVLEDSTDIAGLFIAFLGVFLSARFRTSLFDGVASILIGLLLMGVALTLVRESKGLLTGEAVTSDAKHRIRSILQADAAVRSVDPPLTMYFGPENVLLAVDIRFREGLPADEIGRAVDRLETAVRSEFPKIKRIFIEAQSIKAA